MKTIRVRVNVVASFGEAMSGNRLVEKPVRPGRCVSLLQLAKRGGYIERVGTTLTEVLMSLMIMSIGIVSVATLFPISALRTLEANKQTNSAIASFNANAAIDARPELIHNPDDGIPESVSLFSTESNASKYTSSLNAALGSDFRGKSYVVDPWGYWELYTLPPAPPALVIHQEFGNVGGAPPTTLYPDARRVKRYPAFLTSAIDAAHFVSQPDNWKFVTEAALDLTASQSPTALTLDIEADLSSINGITGVPATQAVLYRATIFDADGAKSETRLLSSNPTGQQVTWGGPLPTRIMEDQNGSGTLDPGEDYDGDGVLDLPSRVRVEVADQVYTWMLSVRKASTGVCGVDAVIFFKRGFDPAYEEVHTADFRVMPFGMGDYTADPLANPPIPPPNDLPDLGTKPSLPNYRVRVVYTGDPPPVRSGGYVFDTSNAFWYRISKVERETNEDRNGNGSLDPGEDRNGNSVIDPTIDLIVDEPIRANNGPVNSGGAILHPRVVNVFPLDNKRP